MNFIILINKLNLYKCQDTRIGMGDLTKGISGGEKRRLAFAAEVFYYNFLFYYLSVSYIFLIRF